LKATQDRFEHHKPIAKDAIKNAAAHARTNPGRIGNLESGGAFFAAPRVVLSVVWHPRGAICHLPKEAGSQHARRKRSIAGKSGAGELRSEPISEASVRCRAGRGEKRLCVGWIIAFREARNQMKSGLFVSAESAFNFRLIKRQQRYNGIY
jgi:hypothetical protein